MQVGRRGFLKALAAIGVGVGTVVAKGVGALPPPPPPPPPLPPQQAQFPQTVRGVPENGGIYIFSGTSLYPFPPRDPEDLA